MLHVKIYYTVSVNEPGDLHVEKKNVRREILIFLLKRGGNCYYRLNSHVEIQKSS